MKKFVVLLVVVAMTLITAMAYAADVTVGGTVQVRSRDFSNLLLDKSVVDNKADTQRDTQERIMIDVNAKAGDVKGKISIWNDFDTWGRLEKTQGNVVSQATNSAGGKADAFYNNNTIGIREAWINFNLPGIPVNVTAGHQLLSLGNAWFFRSMHFGSDAWVIANQTGNNTAAFVNVKASEGQTFAADDLDAYVLLDVMKLSDKMTAGVDLTAVRDRRAALAGAGSALDRAAAAAGGTTVGAFDDINLYNLGLNFNGDLGVLKLKAQIDIQGGKAKGAAGGADVKFKGNQVVLQATAPVDPVTVNVTLARGTGLKENSSDIDQMVTILDVDPHYTFLYEYKVPTVALNAVSQTATDDNLHTGFANTTALGVGASFAATKSLTVGADLWLLQATEKVNDSNDVGQEIDVKVDWKVAENLTWNWVAGIFKPGDCYGNNTDDATGVQGILAYKF